MVGYGHIYYAVLTRGELININMINAGCACLSDARGNIDEGQKNEDSLFHREID